MVYGGIHFKQKFKEKTGMSHMRLEMAHKL